MSFPIISKAELLKKLHESGVPLKFFDPHATDVMGTCHYHTVKDSVLAGICSFEHFIQAYIELLSVDQQATVYDVLSFASWLKTKEADGCNVSLDIKSWSKEVAYFAAAELSLQR
ncbi:MAG: hypothetical protein RLZZ480_551 [Candidatus Parcubacteria bacterium]|jgi:hypothetical protein